MRIVRKRLAVNKVIEFKQTNHYVLPLTLTSVVEQHDPLAYVTGAMTNLSDDEEITLQIVATPLRLRQAEALEDWIRFEYDGEYSSIWADLINNSLAEVDWYEIVKMNQE